MLIDGFASRSRYKTPWCPRCGYPSEQRQVCVECGLPLHENNVRFLGSQCSSGTSFVAAVIAVFCMPLLALAAVALQQYGATVPLADRPSKWFGVVIWILLAAAALVANARLRLGLLRRPSIFFSCLLSVVALTGGLEWLSPDISEAREPVLLLISIASFMIVVRAVATDARQMQGPSITRWSSGFESFAFVATAVLLLANFVGILLPTLRAPLTLIWVLIAIVAVCALAGLYLAVIRSREIQKQWTIAMS